MWKGTNVVKFNTEITVSKSVHGSVCFLTKNEMEGPEQTEFLLALAKASMMYTKSHRNTTQAQNKLVL